MIPFHEAMNSKGWLRRSVIDSAARHLCGIALGVALISPADFLKQLP
jgi:hypothetical protein